jgi:hypothetical protein
MLERVIKALNERDARDFVRIEPRIIGGTIAPGKRSIRQPYLHPFFGRQILRFD